MLELEPFDLAYVPVKAKSILFERPAAISRRKDREGNREPGSFVLSSKLDLKVHVTGDQIEQVTWGFLRPAVGGANEGPPKSGYDFLVVRAVHDLDWQKRIREACERPSSKPSGWVTVAFERRTYCKLRGRELSPRHEACFYFPDPRTVVMADEECVREVIRQPAGSQPDLASGDRWQAISRTLVAAAWEQEGEECVYDEISGMWMELVGGILPLKTKEPRRIVCGLGGDDVFHMDARFEFGDPGTASRAARDAIGNLHVSKVEIAALRRSGQLEQSDGMLRSMLDLASDCQVRADGRTVEITSRCQLNVNACFGGEAAKPRKP